MRLVWGKDKTTDNIIPTHYDSWEEKEKKTRLVPDWEARVKAHSGSKSVEVMAPLLFDPVFQPVFLGGNVVQRVTLFPAPPSFSLLARKIAAEYKVRERERERGPAGEKKCFFR